MAKRIELVLSASSLEGAVEVSPRLHPIVVMKAGPSTVVHPISKLNVYFPWEVIARDGPSVFEGAQAKAGHNTGDVDDPTGINGVVKDVFEDHETQELRATYICLDDEVQRKVANAKAEGVLEQLFEFSMKTPAETHQEVIDGTRYEVADRLIKFVHTRVDTVSKGAAGGRFVTLAASQGDETSTMDWKTYKAEKPEQAASLLATSSLPDALVKIGSTEGLEANGAFYGDFSAAYAEANTVDAVSTTGVVSAELRLADADPNVAIAVQAAASTQAALKEMRSIQVDNKLLTSDLDQASRDYVKASLLECSSGDEMEKIISRHREFVKTQSGAPVMANTGQRDSTSAMLQGSSSITSGDDAFDVFRAACEGLFAGKSVRLETGSKTIVPRFRNYKEVAQNHPTNPRAYRTAPELMASANDWFKGSEYGNLVKRGPDRSSVLLEAAVGTSTHTEIFADVMHKRIISTYHSGTEVEEVRAMASQQIEVDDFKSYKFISLAEYINPSSVGEGDTYGSLTTPADIQESQSVTKYGFIETITMESLVDPDGQVFLMLPQRMGQAMKRLERETYLNAITTDNAAMDWDAVTLYHADHNNQNTTALTLTSLAAASVAMQKQAARGSSARYGSRLRPHYIMVPIDLEDLVDRIINPTGFEMALTAPGASVELNKGAYTGLKKIVLTHQTNTGDWFLMAKPNSAGALDGVDTFATLRLRGVNEPEFFTQDSEDSESRFGSDKINWKVRDFFGVKPLDERAFYFQNV